MLKYGHQNFNLARVIFTTSICIKFATKVGLHMRKNKICFAVNPYGAANEYPQHRFSKYQYCLVEKSTLSGAMIYYQNFQSCLQYKTPKKYKNIIMVSKS